MPSSARTTYFGQHGVGQVARCPQQVHDCLGFHKAVSVCVQRRKLRVEVLALGSAKKISHTRTQQYHSKPSKKNIYFVFFSQRGDLSGEDAININVLLESLLDNRLGQEEAVLLVKVDREQVVTNKLLVKAILTTSGLVFGGGPEAGRVFKLVLYEKGGTGNIFI